MGRTVATYNSGPRFESTHCFFIEHLNTVNFTYRYRKDRKYENKENETENGVFLSFNQCDQMSNKK